MLQLICASHRSGLTEIRPQQVSLPSPYLFYPHNPGLLERFFNDLGRIVDRERLSFYRVDVPDHYRLRIVLRAVNGSSNPPFVQVAGEATPLLSGPLVSMCTVQIDDPAPLPCRAVTIFANGQVQSLQEMADDEACYVM